MKCRFPWRKMYVEASPTFSSKLKLKNLIIGQLRCLSEKSAFIVSAHNRKHLGYYTRCDTEQCFQLYFVNCFKIAKSFSNVFFLFFFFQNIRAIAHLQKKTIEIDFTKYFSIVLIVRKVSVLQHCNMIAKVDNTVYTSLSWEY